MNLEDIYELVDKIDFKNFTHTQTIFLLTKIISKANRELLGQSVDMTCKEIEYVFNHQLPYCKANNEIEYLWPKEIV